MGVDLSFLEADTTLGRMDTALATKVEKPRNYLGMSEIGDCARKLWLKFHVGAVDVPTPRMMRLFGLGDMIEARVVKELKAAGFKISGRQKPFKDFKGKFKGHCDGIVEGLPESSKPHILEVKSANDKNFELFQKKGVKGQSFKYWAQVQCYMGYAKLERAIIIIESKNTSDRYQERIHFDKDSFESLKAKAGAIIHAKTPPSGVNDWTCEWCPCNTSELCKKNWGGSPF